MKITISPNIVKALLSICNKKNSSNPRAEVIHVQRGPSETVLYATDGYGALFAKLPNECVEVLTAPETELTRGWRQISIEVAEYIVNSSKKKDVAEIVLVQKNDGGGLLQETRVSGTAYTEKLKVDAKDYMPKNRLELDTFSRHVTLRGKELSKELTPLCPKKLVKLHRALQIAEGRKFDTDLLMVTHRGKAAPALVYYASYIPKAFAILMPQWHMKQETFADASGEICKLLDY